jgi:hypothetical protein
MRMNMMESLVELVKFENETILKLREKLRRAQMILYYLNEKRITMPEYINTGDVISLVWATEALSIDVHKDTCVLNYFDKSTQCYEEVKISNFSFKELEKLQLEKYFIAYSFHE